MLFVPPSLMSVSLGTSPCSSTDAVGKVSADGLLLALAKVPDPRDPRDVRYRLATLLAIGVCANDGGWTQLSGSDRGMGPSV